MAANEGNYPFSSVEISAASYSSMLADSGLIRNSRAKSSLQMVATFSGGDFVIFRVVDVNKPPLSNLFAVDLRFDAVGCHGRSIFAHRRPKDPAEFRPRRVSIHMNRRAARLKIACREHAAH